MVTLYGVLRVLSFLHCIHLSHSSFLGLYDDSCDSDTIRPNIVMILMDDLGWADLSIKNGEFPTPNMNTLVNNSLQFVRHYVHLMGSPSRTQFLTGRYAMNLGLGEFGSWQYKRMIGIPVGQPTLANWLSEFGTYSTYAVGKWNLGYAHENLLPAAKGFQRFYGFYQGAIEYINHKRYFDVDDGVTNYFDFWEDGSPSYDSIQSSNTTLQLFADKIEEYMEEEGNKRKHRRLLSKRVDPFFLYVAMQSMHKPFPKFEDLPSSYESLCLHYLSGDVFYSDNYRNQRMKYCALTLLTDQIIGQIVDSLKSNKLWKNTLVLFSSDNGGATYAGASNYPFRGTKGESFEGNNRVMAALSGGVIEDAGLSGAVKEAMVSNLDWTPTLLHFAGYLKCINPDDYSWEGKDQHGLIMGSANYKERSALILNIGDRDLKSTSILILQDGTWWKYINQNSDSIKNTDKWVKTADTSGGVWSTHTSMGIGMKIYGATNDSNLSYSGAVTLREGNAYLFNIKEDISEKYNILNQDCSCYDEDKAEEVTNVAYELLSKYISSQPLFTPPMEGLKLELKEGEPDTLSADDGDLSSRFLGPFLTDEEYFHGINSLFDEANMSGTPMSAELKSLYTVTWSVPSALPPSSAQMFTKVIVILIIAAALLAICCTVIMYYCNKSRRQRYGPYTYTPIKDEEMEEANREQRTEVYIYT